MIKILSNKIARIIEKNSISPKASTAVLAYGVEIIIISVIGFLLLVVSSLILGHPFAWLYFSIGFVPLRTTGGGFHAKSHIGCFAITVLMFTVSVLLSYHLLWNPLAYFVISLISLVLIILLSPVEASNKPLNAMRKRANRCRSIIISACFIACSVVLLAAGISIGALNLVWMGIASSSASLLVAKVIYKGRRKEP